MQRLPDQPNLGHLKKQAKDLLRLARSGDDGAAARFRSALPFAPPPHGLHDAQTCIAREYGFRSWSELSADVEARSFARLDQAARAARWLALAYGGAVTGSLQPAQPTVAARVLADDPGLADRDPFVACAAGNEPVLRRTMAADPAWVNRPGGPLKLPPLVAVTHSRLAEIPEFRGRLLDSARCLLEAGASPNQSIGNRFPPASLAQPDEGNKLSALYGAAGANHDVDMTALLLDAGADPNDGESLYHSLEDVACTRLLLQRGARIGGTNALPRSLDMADPAALELLLSHGGDANESSVGPLANVWGAPLLRAIALRRSRRHVELLLAAGADPGGRTPQGVGAYRLAMQVGLTEVASLLRDAGAAEPLSLDDQFAAACARADGAEARRIKALRPDLPGSLPEAQHRLLPDTVAWGSDAAARVMVELGWPIAARGADWTASALNLAVFRGDPRLTAFLLDHGASWEEQQGYGDDVLGTLAWASVNEPAIYKPAAERDWAGCARALLAHGMPAAEPDPTDPETVRIAGRRARFSADVTDVLLAGG